MLKLVKPSRRASPPAQETDLDGNSPQGKAYVQRVYDRLLEVPTRRWTYLQVARRARRGHNGRALLSRGEYDILHSLIERTRPDLTSSFPSARTIAKLENYSERHVKRVLASLVKKGWLRRPRRRDGDNGANTSTVNQFCIPSGAIMPWSNEWLGPQGDVP